MSFDRARRIADAVLLEGYCLYPWRATSAKNRYRWTFGVLAPETWSRAGGCERSWIETQVLLAGAAERVRGRLRFFSIVKRDVEAWTGQRFEPTGSLEIDGRSHVTWEEGELVEIDFDASSDARVSFETSDRESIHLLRDASGVLRGRVTRTSSGLSGIIRVRTTPLEAPRGEDPLCLVAVRVENVTGDVPAALQRSEVLRFSFASTHVILACEGNGARFVSVIDPPAHLRAIAAGCTSVGCWPVLVDGDEHGPTRDDLVLAAPIVLSDHPTIAPESTGDACEASEIDELLALRARSLTPDEKAEARATDPRAANIIARADALTERELMRLHGARRAPASLVPGGRVRLRPDRATGRTDVQDLLFANRTATIHAIRHDVAGREYVCITFDDDPAAALNAERGIYHHYFAEELEPLDPISTATPSPHREGL